MRALEIIDNVKEELAHIRLTESEKVFFERSVKELRKEIKKLGEVHDIAYSAMEDFKEYAQQLSELE